MAIHYLMNVVDPPLVPNLQLLCPPFTEQSNGAGFGEHDARFFNNEAKLRGRAWYNKTFGNQQSVGELVRGLFAYYGSHNRTAPSGGFNWVQNVISIRTRGGILSKLGKGWNTAKTDEDGTQLRFLIAIEDPFEHSHNVGRTVTDKGLKAIRAEFSRAQTVIRGIQEIPGVGWEWRMGNGEVGQDLLAEAEDNPQTRKFSGSFPEIKDVQAASTPELDCLKASRACNELICPATSVVSQKQRTQREYSRREVTLAATAMRRMLHTSESQDPNTPYGVCLDSRQFHGPNSIHERNPTTRVQINQRETDTINVQLFATLPFGGKSLC
jgi:terminal uridylyltransferase